MDKPYKVIWKYKNDNRYPQYHVYVFVGDMRSNLFPIFKKIEELNLFDTLIELSLGEIKKLVNAYGDEWYKSFFNMYHTAFMISQIDNNASMSKDIKDKFGNEWYDKHIKSHKWADRKLLYSYASLIKEDKERKTVKKGRLMAIKEDEELADYRINKNIEIRKIIEQRIARVQTADSDETDKKQNQIAGGVRTNSKIRKSQNSRVVVDSVDSELDNPTLLEGNEKRKSIYQSRTAKASETSKVSDLYITEITDNSPSTDYNLDLIRSDNSFESFGKLDQRIESGKTNEIVNRGFYNWETKEHYRLDNNTFYGIDEEIMNASSGLGGLKINKLKRRNANKQFGGQSEDVDEIGEIGEMEQKFRGLKMVSRTFNFQFWSCCTTNRQTRGPYWTSHFLSLTSRTRATRPIDHSWSWGTRLGNISSQKLVV